MKKFFTKFKKLLFFALICLINVNFFAATVSDNDGSAFISKSELDSLENDFQSQLDFYNNNIDKKITDAIASYLEGIKVSRQSTYDLIYKDSDTKDINFMNGAINPEFALPTMNVFNNLQVVVYVSNGRINLSGAWGYVVNNAWTANGTNKRPLLGSVAGNEASVGDIYWRGVALRYHEYYEMASTRYYYKTDSWPSGMDRSDTIHYIKLNYPCVTNYEGYNANMDREQVNSSLVSHMLIHIVQELLLV